MVLKLSAKLISALPFVACTATINAQSAAYVPSTDLPNGKQIVAVYFGAQSFGPCHHPDVKEAVASMKLLVGAQARVAGAMFAAIGVANDWDSRVAANSSRPTVVSIRWFWAAISRILPSNNSCGVIRTVYHPCRKL